MVVVAVVAPAVMVAVVAVVVEVVMVVEVVVVVAGTRKGKVSSANESRVDLPEDVKNQQIHKRYFFFFSNRNIQPKTHLFSPGPLRWQ
jgi:hypothetical protein